ADRVLPFEPRVYADEQAAAAAARGGKARCRLGRSADADAVGVPPPRLYARIDPRLHPPDGRDEEGARHRAGAPRKLHPRGLERARGAPLRGARPAQADARELPGRSRRVARGGESPGPTGAWYAARAVLA